MKRLSDVIFSLAGVLALSPLFLVIAALIKKEDGGPVFYRGERVGLRGKPFKIFKFRSMVVDAEMMGASSTADDDPRITRLGAFLRKYKLDELPQVINVLLGDMSIVGPRPQVRWAVELYDDKEMELLSVRPGITDYASIRFKNEPEILKGCADPDKAYLEIIAPEKIRLGLEYVRNRSLWADVCIIFATFKALIERK